MQMNLYKLSTSPIDYFEIVSDHFMVISDNSENIIKIRKNYHE